MKKLLLIVSLAVAFASCNNYGGDDDDYVAFKSYQVPTAFTTQYWYTKEKNGIWFYIVSPIELTHGSQVTPWNHASEKPRELNAAGVIQLPDDAVRVDELPYQLRWELGY